VEHEVRTASGEMKAAAGRTTKTTTAKQQAKEVT
jgi:hypothetical protein